MTTTTTGDSSTTTQRQDRRTSRQRRTEEQRAKFEAFSRAHRRKRLVLGGTATLLAVASAVLLFLFFPRPTVAQGHQVPIEGNRQHVRTGEPMEYRNRPPSSGDHYDQPAGYGVFQREIPLPNLVHTLEHGGVVVYYRPDLCDQACVGVLQQTYASAPKSQRYGMVKMSVVPWQDMDHVVTAAAWGWVDEMDQPDASRLVAFYREHVDRGPEDAL